MKSFKFLTVLFLAVSVGFSSCKKDKDEEVMASIVGKWGVSKMVEVEIEGTKAPVTETTTVFTAEDFIEFKSDGKVTVSEDGDTDTGTYSVNAETKKLTITITSSLPEVWDIRTINSTDLVLYNELSVTGNNTTWKYTTETSFKKK